MRNEMEMLVLSTCRLYNYEFDGSFSVVAIVDEKYKSINRCIIYQCKKATLKETLKQLSFAWKEAIALTRGRKKKIVFNFFHLSRFDNQINWIPSERETIRSKRHKKKVTLTHSQWNIEPMQMARKHTDSDEHASVVTAKCITHTLQCILLAFMGSFYTVQCAH